MKAPKALRDKILDMARAYRLQHEFDRYLALEIAEIDWNYIEQGDVHHTE